MNTTYSLKILGNLQTGGLFGHMPIVVIAGDFLQIKPAADISIAEDHEALQKAGGKYTMNTTSPNELS